MKAKEINEVILFEEMQKKRQEMRHKEFIDSMLEKGIKIMGKHFDDIPLRVDQIEALKGMERIKQLSALMREAEASLEPCPFCGRPAVIDGVFSYSSPGIRAGCMFCHIHTIPILEGYDLVRDKKLSVEDCLEIAASYWNQRAEEKAAAEKRG